MMILCYIEKQYRPNCKVLFIQVCQVWRLDEERHSILQLPRLRPHLCSLCQDAHLRIQHNETLKSLALGGLPQTLIAPDRNWDKTRPCTTVRDSEDILEQSPFQKYTTCWVFLALYFAFAHLTHGNMIFIGPRCPWGPIYRLPLPDITSAWCSFAI